MASITNDLCVSFLDELLGGVHDLDTSGDTIKIALLKSADSLNGSYDVDTANYSDVTGNSDEASGAGYTSGGTTLSGQVVANASGSAYLDFTDASWTITGTITAGGALIYNSSQSDKAIAVLDFGGDQTANDQTFTIVFPVADQNNAIIRLG
jgi:hypothetical protein